MRYFILGIVSICAQWSYSQTGQNIVPNSGFEVYTSYPIGWFYTGDHFSNVVKYWSSPTAASPDVYGERISVPKLWRDKGFGAIPPHQGNSMVGITVVGCGDGKPHCREYLQTPLLDALVIGQQYKIQLWVSHLEGGYIVDELGLVLNTKRTYVEDDIRLEFQDIIPLKSVSTKDDKWQLMEATFIAETEADYMVVGNFYNDLDSRARRSENQSLSFGYCYIDDMVVQKIAPIIPTPDRKATWEGKELKPPATFALKNIFFETDKATLLPRSYIELEKLLVLLKEHPEMTIRINGHTDSDGGESYNDELSIRRAVAVESFLKAQSINATRLSVAGFGQHQPISDNDTADGKQLNRRVEFTIISM